MSVSRGQSWAATDATDTNTSLNVTGAADITAGSALVLQIGYLENQTTPVISSISPGAWTKLTFHDADLYCYICLNCPAINHTTGITINYGSSLSFPRSGCLTEYKSTIGTGWKVLSSPAVVSSGSAGTVMTTNGVTTSGASSQLNAVCVSSFVQVRGSATIPDFAGNGNTNGYTTNTFQRVNNATQSICMYAMDKIITADVSNQVTSLTSNTSLIWSCVAIALQEGLTPTLWIPEQHSGPPIRGTPWLLQLPLEPASVKAPQLAPIPALASWDYQEQLIGGPPMRGAPWFRNIPREQPTTGLVAPAPMLGKVGKGTSPGSSSITTTWTGGGQSTQGSSILGFLYSSTQNGAIPTPPANFALVNSEADTNGTSAVYKWEGAQAVSGVTINASALGSACNFDIIEVLNANVEDAHAAVAAPLGTTLATNPLTTSNPNDILIALFGARSITVTPKQLSTPATGFTQCQSDNENSDGVTAATTYETYELASSTVSGFTTTCQSNLLTGYHAYFIAFKGVLQPSTTTTLIFGSSTNWIVPPNVRTLTVTCLGPGGGGGGGNISAPGGSGGGGGGGGVAQATVNVSPGDTISINTPAGGAGGAAGSAGSSTSSTFVDDLTSGANLCASAPGGSGSAGSVGLGGTAGIGGSGSIGSTLRSGGNGASGSGPSSVTPGGGGASACLTQPVSFPQANATRTQGGHAFIDGAYSGFDGGNGGSPGWEGTGYGAGGGGGAPGFRGGSGGGGLVIITYSVGVNYSPFPEAQAGPPILGAPWLKFRPFEYEADKHVNIPPPPRVDFNTIREVTEGPPMRGAPWVTLLPVQAIIGVPLPPPITVQKFAPELATRPGPFGTPLFKTAPWEYEAEKHVNIPPPPKVDYNTITEGQGGPPMPGSPMFHAGPPLPANPGTTNAPPQPPPGPVFGLARQKPWIMRDPLADRRVRGHEDQVATMINSLLAKGYIQLVGPGSFDIVGGGVQSNRPPIATDDINSGITVGTVWVDQTAGKVYVCLNNAAGGAIWRGPL